MLMTMFSIKYVFFEFSMEKKIQKKIVSNDCELNETNNKYVIHVRLNTSICYKNNGGGVFETLLYSFDEKQKIVFFFPLKSNTEKNKLKFNFSCLANDDGTFMLYGILLIPSSSNGSGKKKRFKPVD